MIYFAKGLRSGLWKVGYTARRVDVRARALACAVRESVEVVAVAPGGRDAEAALHRALAASCATEANRGREWYRDDGSIAAFVETLPAENRGSYVHVYGRKTRRSADVVEAERLAKRAADDARYLKTHGHARDRFGRNVEGCAQCRKELARYLKFRDSYRRTVDARPRSVAAVAPDFMRSEVA